VRSVVFAPPCQNGGVKSLYTACEGLDRLGCSRIASFGEPRLATWFAHECQLYDGSYQPDVIVYPEIYQPVFPNSRHICFLLGKYATPLPHADLVVCRSDDLALWVAEQNLTTPVATMRPSINRRVFEYDGRPKQKTIGYMTRPDKHPELADLLKERYGDIVIEIVNRSETEVADMLKSAKVFVYRGNDKEGSPRPPKEALVAGCIVVGLYEDLNEGYHTDFGLKCASVDELIEKAGEALEMPAPKQAEGDVVRDGEEEKSDWAALLGKSQPSEPVSAVG
jgi:hypothetical protein